MRRAVATALDEARRSADDLMRHLLDLEATWLEARVLEMIEVDLARAPFVVEAVEAPRKARLGALTLDLRLDRVDRLADGSLAVIDYKTGANAEIRAWLDERPRLPQMPAYVQALGPEQVGAVAFARVRSGDTGYVGVARDSRAVPRTQGAWHAGLAARLRLVARNCWPPGSGGSRPWLRSTPPAMRDWRRTRRGPANTATSARCAGSRRRAPRSRARRPPMSDLRAADARARERALDVGRSFIVQAPAGAGKTELLTRRFLALLATVAEPESILAITFTRKAAAEMRDRILGALRAVHAPDPARPLQERTLQLARAALAADATRGWNLLAQPGRLRIQTIDALNLGLARRLPLLSGLGAGLGIEEDARELYRTAAERLLEQLPHGVASDSAAVATLLAHVDNRVGLFVELVIEMLMRREGWLPVLPDDVRSDTEQARLRERLESARRRLVSSHLESLQRAIPQSLLRDASEVAEAAARNLAAAGEASAICAWTDATQRGGWLARERGALAGPGAIAAHGRWQGALGIRQAGRHSARESRPGPQAACRSRRRSARRARGGRGAAASRTRPAVARIRCRRMAGAAGAIPRAPARGRGTRAGVRRAARRRLPALRLGGPAVAGQRGRADGHRARARCAAAPTCSSTNSRTLPRRR